jgi:hypothetical protein
MQEKGAVPSPHATGVDKEDSLCTLRRADPGPPTPPTGTATAPRHTRRDSGMQ